MTVAELDTEYRSTMTMIDEDCIDLPDVIEWPQSMPSMQQAINEVRRQLRQAQNVTVEVYRNTPAA